MREANICISVPLPRPVYIGASTSLRLYVSVGKMPLRSIPQEEAVIGLQCPKVEDRAFSRCSIKVYYLLIHPFIFRLIKYIDPLLNGSVNCFNGHLLNFRQFQDCICNTELVLPSKASVYAYITCYVTLCHINIINVLVQLSIAFTWMADC